MTRIFACFAIVCAGLLFALVPITAQAQYARPGQPGSGFQTGAPVEEEKDKGVKMEDLAPEPTPSGTKSNSTQTRERDLKVLNGETVAKEKLNLDPENTIYLDLEYGRVVIQLHPELAPKTVARVKELVRQGFYDGLIFHRVIDGFMAQTGDPKGDGTGGSGQNLPAEFNSGRHARGAVSMARAANINSADSQFFIVLSDQPHLDGQYTYFGQVVTGMDFVDQIRKGDPDRNGKVVYPDRIVQMQVMADAVKKEPKAQAEAQTAPAPGKAATKRD